MLIHLNRKKNNSLKHYKRILSNEITPMDFIKKSCS